MHSWKGDFLPNCYFKKEPKYLLYSINCILLMLCIQGRFDALLALLRRQYDRVAVMRPTANDEV